MYIATINFSDFRNETSSILLVVLSSSEILISIKVTVLGQVSLKVTHSSNAVRCESRVVSRGKVDIAITSNNLTLLCKLIYLSIN